jgi:hypothetical protein
MTQVSVLAVTDAGAEFTADNRIILMKEEFGKDLAPHRVKHRTLKR